MVRALYVAAAACAVALSPHNTLTASAAPLERLVDVPQCCMPCVKMGAACDLCCPTAPPSDSLVPSAVGTLPFIRYDGRRETVRPIDVTGDEAAGDGDGDGGVGAFFDGRRETVSIDVTGDGEGDGDGDGGVGAFFDGGRRETDSITDVTGDDGGDGDGGDVFDGTLYR